MNDTVERSPESADAVTALGALYAGTGRLTESEAMFRKERRRQLWRKFELQAELWGGPAVRPIFHLDPPGRAWLLLDHNCIQEGRCL
jgi:hypothetical protein